MQLFIFGYLKFDPAYYPDVVNSDDWRLFNDWCTKYFYYSNDIFSAKKEILQHQGKFTLIYIIMHSDNCNAQTAVDKIVTLIDKAMSMIITC